MHGFAVFFLLYDVCGSLNSCQGATVVAASIPCVQGEMGSVFVIPQVDVIRVIVSISSRNLQRWIPDTLQYVHGTLDINCKA